MGQRHQAFIVARVVPSRGKAPHYQCIGALHSQWCYGSLPLRAARRFITLIKQPGNAEIIREELRGIEFAGRNLPEERCAVPCPFTQFLFVSAWSVSLDDPADPYSHHASILPATIGPRDSDNDDGLTVIDITDPENVTYCFVPSTDHPDLHAITAEAYVSRYYPEHEHLETLVRFFDDIPRMSASRVMAEVWSAFAPEGSSKTREQPAPVEQKVSSLVELTLRPAIEQAIADGKDDILDFIQMDASRVALAKDIIRSQNQVSDGAFSLLKALASVDQNKTLNLSGFALTGKQVVDLLALHGDSEIVSLNLSHNPTLQVDDLERILQGAPQTIHRLVLFDSGITDEEMVQLLDAKPQLFYHLESLIHPAFLSGYYFESAIQFTPCFTHILFTEQYPHKWTVSLPYFTPNTLAQGLTDFLSPIFAVESIWDYSLENSRPPMAAYAACSRASGIPWGERTVAYLPRQYTQEGKWKFVMVYEDPRLCGGSNKRRCYYTIIRPNKAGEEFLSDENREKTKNDDIFLRPDLVDVFDIRGFFKELELEGRPSPDPKVFEKLLDLFPVDGEDKRLTFLDCDAMKEKIAAR